MQPLELSHANAEAMQWEGYKYAGTDAMTGAGVHITHVPFLDDEIPKLRLKAQSTIAKLAGNTSKADGFQRAVQHNEDTVQFLRRHCQSFYHAQVKPSRLCATQARDGVLDVFKELQT